MEIAELKSITLLPLLDMELMKKLEDIGLSETLGPLDGERMDTLDSPERKLLLMLNATLTRTHLLDLDVKVDLVKSLYVVFAVCILILLTPLVENFSN